MPLTHSQQLEVDQANESIERLRQKIKDMDSFQRDMRLAIFTGNASDVTRSLVRIHQDVIAATNDAPLTEPDKEKIRKAIEGLTRLPSGLDKEGIKRHLEGGIAQTKDAVEAGIQSISKKIAKIKGEDLPQRTSLPPATATPPGNTNKPKDDGDVIILRPTFMGMSIDLNKLWKRMRGR